MTMRQPVSVTVHCALKKNVLILMGNYIIDCLLCIAVTFEIGGTSASDPRTPTHEEESETGWECVWKCHTATQVHHMSFSPDGTLFATSGKSDRLVKVWYENKHCKY